MQKHITKYILPALLFVFVNFDSSNAQDSGEKFGSSGPLFTAGCAQNIGVIAGDPATADFDAVPGNIPAIWFLIGGVSPIPVGSFAIDSTTGVLTFNTAPSDAGNSFNFTVCVTDGVDTSCCGVSFNMLPIERFEVQIENLGNVVAGGRRDVCVNLNKGSEQIWGLDFLINYNPAVMTVVNVTPGSAYNDCEWEYFCYRFRGQDDSALFDLHGLVRITALTEINNGAHFPVCLLPFSAPAELFCLKFHISRDPISDCGFVPIRFFWSECFDNIILYNPGSDPFGVVRKPAISRDIYNYGSTTDISDPDVGYPTFLGAQNLDCPVSELTPSDTIPFRFINLKNGGIELICVDSVNSGHGDIDLNGLCCEVTDVVLFSDYFVYGLSVFTINPSGQIAATDVNGDGVVLSIIDFMHLIRIVVGDIYPASKVAPIEATIFRNQAGDLYLDGASAAAIVMNLSGKVQPILLAANMEMKYSYDLENDVTRVLIFSLENGAEFTGKFVSIGESKLINFELAAYDATAIRANLAYTPNNHALFQNYPNPFNASTVISFDIPKRSKYRVTIFNLTGQVIEEFTGESESGIVNINWNADKLPSGVYFYKLVSGSFIDSRKMLLIK